MEQASTALFFDSYSAHPAPVRVLLFGGRVHLHDPYDDRFIQSFPLTGATHNKVGTHHFLYLDSSGLQYLQLESSQPVLSSFQSQLAAANQTWAQKLMQQRLLLLIPVMLGLFIGLYFLLLSLVPFLGLRAINRETEIALGNKLHQVLLSEVDLLSGKIDTSGTAQLQAFANHIKLSDSYPIRLTLVHSPIENAYALPGGQVVVYSGILKKIKSPEALAALLAHESSHVNSRHSLRSLLRSSANGLLVSIVFGDVTGISGAMMSNAENLSGLRYSRSLEADADKKGMELLKANNVPPQGMVQLMQLLGKEKDIPEALTFLSSHPLTRNRLHAAMAYCKRNTNIVTVSNELKTAFNVLQSQLKKAS